LRADAQVMPADLAAPAPLAPGAQLPVARYRFCFRMREPLRLPQYAGSLLRGQFGSALRRSACITGAKACAGCPLLTTCPYPMIFETPAPPEHRLQKFSAVPNPYVIEPPAGVRRLGAGDTLRFDVVLIGRALERLALIAHALQRALGEGLGKARARGDLIDITLETAAGREAVWDSASGKLAAHTAQLTVPEFPRTREVTLAFETPLRLQEKGQPLSAAQLSPRALVMALVRRIELLFEFHAGVAGLGAQAPALARAAESLFEQRDLRWKDLVRYSSRQRQTVPQGGVIGTWTLRGELQPLLPWLWLGQWLHAGKSATMGLGGYRLKVGATASA
jgi:hypothetical protein